MDEAFVREIALLGTTNFEKLRRAHVAVFGIGGVGSYAAEALVRAGVGRLTFVDGDAVAPSNLNRQLIALRSTLGKNKAQAMRERALDIAPDCDVRAVPAFFTAENAAEFPFSSYDFVADCIDSVKDKAELLCAARAAGVPVVSSMGAGNKLDPAAFRVTPLEQTREDPLARRMRQELRRRGVTGVLAVWSAEPPRPFDPACAAEGERRVGSLSFVPSAAGLVLAGAIVRRIAGV